MESQTHSMLSVKDDHARITLQPDGEIIVSYHDQKHRPPYQFFYESVEDMRRDYVLMGEFLREADHGRAKRKS